MGDGWRAVELADVVMGDGLKTIYAARFRLPGSDEMHYVIDTASTLDFAHGRPLKFQQRPHMLVADLEVEVRSTAGGRRRIPYQVLLSDDGYTYARIAEYLSGHVRVSGHEYALKVRSAWRNVPFYGATANTVFLVDLNGDGTLAEQPAVTAAAGPMAAEQVFPHAPFRLRGRAFEVADIDSMGLRLVIRRSTATIAAVENFRAPEFSAETLADSNFKLSAQAGNVVFIEFWSVNCAFSEKARPTLNDLATAARGKPFTWVAVAAESDRAEIQHHLAEHPMNGIVTRADSSAWGTYNPARATPLFVVVDRDGIIRFRAVGSTASTAVAAKVRQLLAPGTPR
jgi:thiol-disulfide isomerase/thioredoxin